MTSLIPTLAVVDGIPRASSLDIATHFGKRHVDVMRAINNSVTQVPEDFAQRNFAFSDYQDSTGRNLPKCDLSHDGFSFVVMGFTGKEAAKWKVVYIMAFRAMAEELTSRPAPSLDTSSRLSTRKDPERKELHALVNTWVGCAPIHYAGARNIINAHFGVKSVDELTVRQVREAVALIHQRIAETPKQAALPASEPPADLDLSTYFASMRSHSRRLMREYSDMIVALKVAYPMNWNRQLDHGSTDYAVLPMLDMVGDFAGVLDGTLRAIQNHAEAFARVKRL